MSLTVAMTIVAVVIQAVTKTDDQCFLFQNSLKRFLGYFDPENVFIDNKNKQFSG